MESWSHHGGKGHRGSPTVITSLNETRWVATAARQIDYVVMTGGDLFAIMERYAEATGKPPLLPWWAAGFWQSNNRYTSQREVLEVARDYKRRGIPLSAIVIDYAHRTATGNFKFQPEAWPDPAAMVRELGGCLERGVAGRTNGVLQWIYEPHDRSGAGDRRPLDRGGARAPGRDVLRSRSERGRRACTSAGPARRR